MPNPITITVVYPPSGGDGYLITSDTPSIQVDKDALQVTVNLVTQRFVAGGLPTPVGWVPGQWQFQNLPLVSNNIGTSRIVSFAGITFWIPNATASTPSLADLLVYTPSSPFGPRIVAFTVKPAATPVTIQYRVQVVHQYGNLSLVLDPTIKDQGSNA